MSYLQYVQIDDRKEISQMHHFHDFIAMQLRQWQLVVASSCIIIARVYNIILT